MHTQKNTRCCEENTRRQAFPESCEGNVLNELPVGNYVESVCLESFSGTISAVSSDLYCIIQQK